MTRDEAKLIALALLAKTRRFRLVVDQHRMFSPLYSVVERISESEHRYAQGELGTQVWYASREDAERWCNELNAKARK